MKRVLRVGMKRRVTVVALLVAVAAVPAGCGGGDNGEPEAAETVGATATAVAEPSAVLGTYSATFAEGDVPQDPGVEVVPGEWRLEITETAVTLTDPTGKQFPPGEVSGEEIVFPVDPECPVQGKNNPYDPRPPGKGTYSWSLEGRELQLTELDDTCRDRAFMLTARRWARTE